MLKAGFILLTIVLAVILFAGAASVARRAFPDDKVRKRFLLKAALVLTGWLAYVCIISLTGIFTSVSLPPRIPLLLVLPAFLFFIYFFRSRHYRPVVDNTPAAWPVYFQSFRIFVELLIWGAYLQGNLPKAASFEGYNFDVLIGLTASLAGLLLFAHGRPRSTKLVIAWNIAGLLTLAIVVFILISQAYFYSIWGLPGTIIDMGFGLFPYTLLAGFLMPLAVFMHIFSIIKSCRLGRV